MADVKQNHLFIVGFLDAAESIRESLEEIDRERQINSNSWRDVGQNDEIWISDI